MKRKRVSKVSDLLVSGILEHFSEIFRVSLCVLLIVHNDFALAPWENRLKNALGVPHRRAGKARRRRQYSSTARGAAPTSAAVRNAWHTQGAARSTDKEAFGTTVCNRS